MCQAWVVGARREGVQLWVQPTNSSWLIVKKRQVMIDRLTQMLKLNLIQRLPKSARWDSHPVDCYASLY